MKNFHHPNQGLLHDEVWECMCPALRERCKNGWAALFRNTVLHELPAERLAEGKSDDHGRPTVGLYTISGLLLMQQMFDWTFDQTEEAFLARLDVRWPCDRHSAHPSQKRRFSGITRFCRVMRTRAMRSLRM